MKSSQTYEHILAMVDRPSRYLGTEINAVKKNPSVADLRMALAFPDLYEIGTSHFGLQILYNILNKNEKIYAERVFAPGSDMIKRLADNQLPLCSLETRTPLSEFDIVGFSLLYELNYTNVLLMMALGKIPFFSSQRDKTSPIVIAGGPCTCNPEPMADFFDAIVIGDGEEVLVKMCSAYLEWKDNEGNDKTALLKSWSAIEGVYVPSFFQASIDDKGFQRLVPDDPEHVNVRRAILPDLNTADFPLAPILPCSKPVHDRLRIEVSRGCTRGCRFCQAGMIYRPVRERSFETLSAIAEQSLSATGYEDISLLSLSTGDYSSLVPLMAQLLDKQRRHPLAVSLPSLRAETLTPKLMELIKRVRKTGFTIAPEAGSQRLRDVINKNISEKDIIDTVAGALEMGWNGIKLYFMIGLPTETDKDIAGIVDLVNKLRGIKTQNRRPNQITVSVGTFIPKSHTPFQWASQLSLTEAKSKLLWLKEKLNLSKIHFKWQNPEVSMLEGLWARGDRRLSKLLLAAYENGCRFDGWSDQFDFALWNQAMSETGIHMDDFTTRNRSMDEPLPWDHIDIGLTEGFLKKEWQKAVLMESTADCRWGECIGCGVCDFIKISPRLYETPQREPDPVFEEVADQPVFKKIKVTFSKIHQARFLGHLEMVNIIIRAIRRAGIPVKYSEGYHPKPKISFSDPLPLGMEGLKESFILTVYEHVKPRDVLAALKHQLPEGLVVQDCKIEFSKKPSQAPKPITYVIRLSDGCFDENDLESFLKSDQWIIYLANKKGREIAVDLKQAVIRICLKSPETLELSILEQKGKTVRPADILGPVFDLKADQLRTARVVKN